MHALKISFDMMHLAVVDGSGKYTAIFIFKGIGTKINKVHFSVITID